ncbi:MAG TPA: hypothetical protein DCO79_11625 [Spirochaeta sp.]|nr:hypothetical protein [Spirochaeta sp.]
MLKYILIFSCGTIVGWGIEVIWRRFLGEARRWINPGFLSGPWLPLYGFGSIFLYLFCLPEPPLYILAPVFLVVLTVLEYIAGVIFIGYFKIRLWDYSRNRGNIKGLICPLYSFLWMGLGVFFYLVIFTRLNSMVEMLYRHLEISFFIGIYGGLFVTDLWQSFNLAARIKSFASETEEKLSVDFERLKLELRDRVQFGVINRTHFLLPFYGELGASFREQLKKHRWRKKTE